MLAFAPLDVAVAAASTAVTALASGIEPLAGGAATAAAIVLSTIVVRLLTTPLTVAQIRGERHRAALAPQVREVQRRYADDPARLRAALAELYRSAGASPLAGCLPALLQAPFFLVMYRLFTTDGAGLLTERLAGVPLGHHLTDGLAGVAGPLFGVLLVALLALARLASLRMRRAAAVGATPPGGPAGAVGGPAGDGAAVVGRLLPLLPYATLVVAVVLPLGGVLYLVTTTAWTALEQTLLRRERPIDPATLDRNS